MITCSLCAQQARTSTEVVQRPPSLSTYAVLYLTLPPRELTPKLSATPFFLTTSARYEIRCEHQLEAGSNPGRIGQSPTDTSRADIGYVIRIALCEKLAQNYHLIVRTRREDAVYIPQCNHVFGQRYEYSLLSSVTTRDKQRLRVVCRSLLWRVARC
jgi:hypothetical protein